LTHVLLIITDAAFFVNVFLPVAGCRLPAGRARSRILSEGSGAGSAAPFFGSADFPEDGPGQAFA